DLLFFDVVRLVADEVRLRVVLLVLLGVLPHGDALVLLRLDLERRRRLFLLFLLRFGDGDLLLLLLLLLFLFLHERRGRFRLLFFFFLLGRRRGFLRRRVRLRARVDRHFRHARARLDLLAQVIGEREERFPVIVRDGDLVAADAEAEVNPGRNAAPQKR